MALEYKGWRVVRVLPSGEPEVEGFLRFRVDEPLPVCQPCRRKPGKVAKAATMVPAAAFATLYRAPPAAPLAALPAAALAALPAAALAARHGAPPAAPPAAALAALFGAPPAAALALHGAPPAAAPDALHDALPAAALQVALAGASTQRYGDAEKRCFDVAFAAVITNMVVIVYVLHLARRHDRRENVETIGRQFAGTRVIEVAALDGVGLGLSVDFLPQGYRAWPGWMMTQAAFAALQFDDDTGRDGCCLYWMRGLNGGELACALTHLATWARAAAGEEVYNTIIFEDDAQTNTFTASAVMMLLSELRSNGAAFDILRLGRSNADVRGSVLQREEAAEEVHSFKYSRAAKKKTATVIDDVGSWTGAYGLSARAVRLLAASGFGQDLLNVDDFLYCCSSVDHPRKDLYDAPPVKYVRDRGGLTAVTVTMDTQVEFLGITMTAASQKSDCGG